MRVCYWKTFVTFLLLVSSHLINAQTLDPQQTMREVWQDFLRLGVYNEDRHVLVLGDEISPGRYELTAMEAAVQPNEPGIVLAQAEWQEEARYESAISGIWRTGFQEHLNNITSSDHFYVAGTLSYQQRSLALWGMLNDITLRLPHNSVRMLPLLPHGTGTSLQDVSDRAADFASIGAQGTGPTTQSGGWVDPRPLCTCWNGRPPNLNVKLGATVDWPGFAPPSPPTLPVPATKGVGHFDDPRTVLVPWPNHAAGVTRAACRAAAERGENLTMLIGAGMLIGGLAKCWGLIHPIAASACMAGVVIVAAAAAVYVYMQLKDLYAECDNNFCRGVIDMAGQVWFGEVLARLPALQRIQDDIGRLNDRIRNTENEIANKEIELELTQDPQERARLQLQLQRLRDHLRKLQMQMGFKEAELLSAQRNIEPWRNKKTSTEWCIRPGPGQGG